MALELSYEFPGDKKEQFRIASVRLGSLSKDFAKRPFVGPEVKRGMIAWFEDRARSHWSSEGGSSPGGRWPRWAASTAARKSGSDRLMRESGMLHNALIGPGPGSKRDIKDDRAELGVELSAFDGAYPAIHQAGSPGTNLPMRRVIDMGQKDGIALMKVIQSSLVKRARAAGFISGGRSGGVPRGA